MISIDEVKLRVEKSIREIIDNRLKDAEKIHPTYVHFWKAIETMAMADGKKRIRPYLTVLGYGTIDEEIVKIATAQELVHIAMLIHDDIIDKDLMRNGRKNMTGQYIDEYAGLMSATEATHFANSAAILAGDALLSEAYQMLNDSSFDHSIKRLVTAQMHKSIYEVIAGELMDVEATFRPKGTFDPITIYRYKTASYSLVGPLLSGAYCAGSDQKTINKLESFATIAGVMFQVQDDLLGVYGNESKTGKTSIGDLIEDKRTLLVTYHESLMNEEQSARFNEHFGNKNASRKQFEQLKTDMIDSGARDKTLEYIKECDEKITAHLDNIADDHRREGLENLMNMLKNRKS